MKLQSICLLLVPALLSVSSCSDPEHSGFEQVPIELRASGSGEVIAKAGYQEITTAFGTTVFASKREGIYTGIPATDADEWQKDATVEIGGSVSLPDNPTYPENGDWIYLVAAAPKTSTYSSSEGSVSYTLTGQTDLMYARQIKGNRWDGSRFSNTEKKYDTPLEYVHLLTQLKFKAQKETADGLAVKVNSITIQGKAAAKIELSSGETTFSGSNENLTLKLPDGGTEISGTTPATDLGYLLLPPLETGAYKVTVETSIGTFSDLDITFDAAGGGGSNGSGTNHFAAGHSYEITLNIGDRELDILSVSVAEWTTIKQGGDIDLVN